METETLVVEFKVSIEDRVDFTLDAAQGVKQRRRWGSFGTRLAMWAIAALLLVAAVSLFMPGAMPPGQRLHSAPGQSGEWIGLPRTWLPILPALGLLVAVLVIRLFVRGISVRLNRRLCGPVLAEPLAVTCTLDATGIRFSSALEDHAYRWSMLRVVQETKAHLNLVFRPAGGMPIPKRDLSPAQVAAVKAFAEAHLAPASKVRREPA